LTKGPVWVERLAFSTFYVEPSFLFEPGKVEYEVALQRYGSMEYICWLLAIAGGGHVHISLVELYFFTFAKNSRELHSPAISL
jgi:hypothetical protein